MNQAAAQHMAMLEKNESTPGGLNMCIPFPWKLHELLNTAETSSYNNVVSWLPDQNSFKVYQVDRFVEEIMPLYFKQTKYKSFQRQLNMWGFQRILDGPGRGGYGHTCFLRTKPELCRVMKREKIKGSKSAGKTSSSGVSSALQEEATTSSPCTSSEALLAAFSVSEQVLSREELDMYRLLLPSKENNPYYAAPVGDFAMSYPASDAAILAARMAYVLGLYGDGPLINTAGLY
jgi:hypothetical protein